jgi:hypothetical protein
MSRRKTRVMLVLVAAGALVPAMISLGTVAHADDGDNSISISGDPLILLAPVALCF